MWPLLVERLICVNSVVLELYVKWGQLNCTVKRIRETTSYTFLIMPYLFYTCNVKLSTKLISVLWEYFLNNQWMSYFLKQCLNPKTTSIVVVESVFFVFHYIYCKCRKIFVDPRSRNQCPCYYFSSTSQTM